MTLLDLMELYKLKNDKTDVNALLLDMFQSANIDARIDRTVLAGRFLMDCGARTPRYNTTDTFLFFGSVWLQSKANNISQWLDALDIEYNPLIEYEEHRLEDIDREHVTNGTDTKARDVATSSTESSTLNQTNADTRTDNFTDEHLVSAENESGVQLRNRDTHTETVGDNATRTESESVTDSERIDEDVTNTRHDTITHDDTVDTTLSGRKTAAYDLIIKEMEKAKLNIYDSLIDDFADVMFLNVF